MKSPFTFTKLVKDTVPPYWPNRAVRRAVKYGKTLPTEWTMVFSKQPLMLELVKAGKFAA